MTVVWLSIDQMAKLFQRDRSTISCHIKNMFYEGEPTRNSVVANSATTAAGGETCQLDYYNLDVIISVDYCVKSLRGTQFRIWTGEELSMLNSIVSAYFEFAEIQACRIIPVYTGFTPTPSKDHTLLAY